ncbi:MAG: adenylate/guanylate cyclase domain-containing protein [Deltaproteobacteria bacterium]|nr:adenylate/guanylate cyclase domain-containing protein [Deltaproteobacteria bacterium]
MAPLRLTLARFLSLVFAVLVFVLAVVLSLLDAASRRTILVASEQLMRQASRRVTERLAEHLGEAERLVAALEAEAALGLLTAETAEPVLVGALGGHPQVADITFTYGRATGTYEHGDPPHDAGDLRLAPAESGQISVTRATAAESDDLLVRRLTVGAGPWRTEEHWIAPDGTRTPTEPADAETTDPTIHPSFTTPSRPEFRGRALWSDLAFFEADGGLPEAERRRVVSIQKALWTRGGTFLGVARVTLNSDRVDDLTHIAVDDRRPAAAEAAGDEHIVFLCDRFGRLISRVSPSDRLDLLDRDGGPDPDFGDVRVVSAAVPASVAAALAAPALRDATSDEPMVTRLDVGGVSHLVSVAALLGDRMHGWLVGIAVPESRYLGALDASRRRAFGFALALVLPVAATSSIMLRAMRRDIRRLIGQATRLRHFDFAASNDGPASFRDVHEATRSIEQAKTALRALAKYVPLDLVRELYDAHHEPTLGARVQDVTVLFSDVAGFTTVAEALDPDVLATSLGAYLEVLTHAIHASDGIIDKYTGDGVMALWNAPRPIACHPRRACEAAVASVEGLRALFASDAWRGRAPWPTRFGIHRGRVHIGHFGAPDRFSFTAMGDGVNLASRLEGLAKEYGVAIVVSAAVAQGAADAFCFRRLDVVAVKGKQQPVEIYELVGRRIPGKPPPAHVTAYEAALDAYFARRLDEAAALLRAHPDDAPSRHLAARCRDLLVHAPGAEWTGVKVFTTK